MQIVYIMKKFTILVVALALLCSAAPAAKALSFSISVGDQPYYTHGPGYWRSGIYYVWVPGHWKVKKNKKKVWVHGHYRARR